MCSACPVTVRAVDLGGGRFFCLEGYLLVSGVDVENGVWLVMFTVEYFFESRCWTLAWDISIPPNN